MQPNPNGIGTHFTACGDVARLKICRVPQPKKLLGLLVQLRHTPSKSGANDTQIFGFFGEAFPYGLQYMNVSHNMFLKAATALVDVYGRYTGGPEW